MKTYLPRPFASLARSLRPAGPTSSASFEDLRPQHALQAQLRSIIQASASPRPAGPAIFDHNQPAAHTPVVQREGPFDMKGGSMQERLGKQYHSQEIVLKQEEDYSGPPFTTVGFEYEFAQFDFKHAPDSPLHEVTHLELAQSVHPMPFTHLPFTVETDASNAIELVTPPFLIETIGHHPLPNPQVLADFNQAMKGELSNLAQKGHIPSGTPPKKSTSLADKTFNGLLKGLSALTSFEFRPKSPIQIGSSNINPTTPSASTTPLPQPDLLKLATDSITKFDGRGGTTKGTINEQINFATDAYLYDRLRQLPPKEKKSDLAEAFSTLENKLWEQIQKYTTLAPLPDHLRIFLKETARTLSQSAAVPAIQYVEKAKAAIFTDLLPTARYRPNLNKYKGKGKEAGLFNQAADIRSHVKDVDGIWLKDTLYSFAFGLFHTPQDYKDVVDILTQLKANVASIPFPPILVLPLPDLKISPRRFYQQELERNIDILLAYFTSFRNQIPDAYPLPDLPVPFGGHNLDLPGSRHDTLLHPSKVNYLPLFRGTHLHVAEVRDESIERLTSLAEHFSDLIQLLDTHPHKTDKDDRDLQAPLLSFGTRYTHEEIAWVWQRPLQEVDEFLAYDFTSPAPPKTAAPLPLKIPAESPQASAPHSQTSSEPSIEEPAK